MGDVNRPQRDPTTGRYLFWNPARNQYYWYDGQSDHLVYQDTQRFPRPSNVPRSYYENPYNLNPPPGARSPSPTDTRSPVYQYGSNAAGSSSGASATSPVNDLTHRTASLGLRDGFQPQQQVENQDGRRVVTVLDPRSHVRTVIATEPFRTFTDPRLLRAGIQATRMMMPTEGDAETLWPGFSRRPSKFYTTGRVFYVLWVEPMSEPSSRTEITTTYETTDPAVIPGRYQQKVYSKVRRFVVIRENDKFCSALPIVTYGGQGLRKPGVKKSDHAIIFTGNVAPKPVKGEEPRRGEDGMRPRPIAVVLDDKDKDNLDVMSRLDFAKIHTIHHNIKVKPLGMVHPKFMDALTSQFKNVWNVSTDTSVPSALSSAAPASRAGDAEGSEERGGNDDDSSSESSDDEPAKPATDVEGTNALNALTRMIGQGYTQEVAFGIIVNKIQENPPGCSRKKAIARVKVLLQKGREVHIRTAQSAAAQSSATAGASATTRPSVTSRPSAASRPSASSLAATRPSTTARPSASTPAIKKEDSEEEDDSESEDEDSESEDDDSEPEDEDDESDRA